jgi:AraC-like DNA-binding protein
VRASKDGKQWSEESVCVVNVLQPWWWTWWMRLIYILVIAIFVWYEWHQYQQRISLRRQLDQRLTTLYARPVTQADSHIQADSRVKESVDADSGSMESSSQDECDNAGVAEQKASGIDEADNDESANVQEGESKNHSSLLNKLDVIIQDNLQQADIDIAFLATQMCMSHSTLYRRIKTLTGMTVNEYVRRHRLAKAMQLLRDGSNVTETASMCGFSSPNYFSRCFKTEYGISPSEIK